MPQGYSFHIPVQIRYGDMDTLGHVNNAKYLTYIELGRIAYFRHLELWHGGVSDLGLILAKVIIDYKLPVTLEDVEVKVWLRVSRLGTKSFDIESIITRTKDGAEQTVASSTAVLVVYDYKQEESINIPASWRARLQENMA